MTTPRLRCEEVPKESAAEMAEHLDAQCRGQARVTGRLASWVMTDLRIMVFRHLQRLSLDFFTEEKAGVVMSRMTSDIENLQQLLHDGLAQFAVQGLTMVVITVLLFATNVEARRGDHHRGRAAAA